MVLGPQGPGRVGRRRFLDQRRAAQRAARCSWYAGKRVPSPGLAPAPARGWGCSGTRRAGGGAPARARGRERWGPVRPGRQRLAQSPPGCAAPRSRRPAVLPAPSQLSRLWCARGYTGAPAGPHDWLESSGRDRRRRRSLARAARVSHGAAKLEIGDPGRAARAGYSGAPADPTGRWRRRGGPAGALAGLDVLGGVVAAGRHARRRAPTAGGSVAAGVQARRPVRGGSSVPCRPGGWWRRGPRSGAARRARRRTPRRGVIRPTYRMGLQDESPPGVQSASFSGMVRCTRSRRTHTARRAALRRRVVRSTRSIRDQKQPPPACAERAALFACSHAAKPRSVAPAGPLWTSSRAPGAAVPDGAGTQARRGLRGWPSPRVSRCAACACATVPVAGALVRRA
jgi:hypothetical protein